MGLQKLEKPSEEEERKLEEAVRRLQDATWAFVMSSERSLTLQKGRRPYGR